MFKKIKEAVRYFSEYWECIKEETENLTAEERGYKAMRRRERREKRGKIYIRNARS